MPALCRLTGRLHGTIVGPTSRTDQSDRPVGPTIVPCKRPVRDLMSVVLWGYAACGAHTRCPSPNTLGYDCTFTPAYDTRGAYTSLFTADRTFCHRVLVVVRLLSGFLLEVNSPLFLLHFTFIRNDVELQAYVDILLHHIRYVVKIVCNIHLYTDLRTQAYY